MSFIPDAGGASISLEDELTRIGGLKTIFVGDSTIVYLEGIEWSMADSDSNVTSMLTFETEVNGVVQASGSIELPENSFDLPSSIEAGTIVVDKTCAATVSVTIMLEESPDTSTSASGDYQAFAKGASLVPLIVILVLAMVTQMVEISLFLGIWLGACMVTGSLRLGFESTILDYLVGALADEGHVMVILFTVFLAGMIGMMQKSGGMKAFTNVVGGFAKTPRAGQFACMCIGIIIFFDDYANLLLTGETMKPLLDALFVSREKLSFIVDATSAPIASVSPVSSWVGYQIDLVQSEIDTLIERNGELTISTSGFAVFLESIRYSYYSLFMIGLIAMLIFTQRDYGPMLIAERKVRVYDRTDGGPGAMSAGGLDKGKLNAPKEDQPLHVHNFLVPIILWVILVFVILVQTGASGEPGQTFMEKIEGGDSYLGLLFGTMGTVWLAMILYLLQITIPGTGKLALPSPSVLKEMLPWSKAEQRPRFLMTVGESVESFLQGMTRIFLCLVILTLAWACSTINATVCVDRLFAAAITSGAVAYQLLPVLTFIISLLVAIATGTSWGTMAIIFPLILVPTYEASGGDPHVFYATVSAVLGGAIAGDHCSPISDTTVLTALACDVKLMGHVNTQAPYVLWVVVFSILFGYIPAGYGAYPNIVGILLGWVACALFVFFVCVPVVSPTGSWDIFTKLFAAKSAELQELGADCAKKAGGEDVPEKEVPAGVESAAEEVPVKAVDEEVTA